MQYPAGDAPAAVVQQDVERRQHVLVVSASAPDARESTALPAPDPDDPAPAALTLQPQSITVILAPTRVPTHLSGWCCCGWFSSCTDRTAQQRSRR